MRRLKARFMDLKIRNKLMIIYVAAGFIPVLIVFMLCYSQMRNVLYHDAVCPFAGGKAGGL